MADAMAQVRDALGPDAIIVSSFEGKRGRGVEVRAAVESAPAGLGSLVQEADAIEDRLRQRLQGELSSELSLLKKHVKDPHGVPQDAPKPTPQPEDVRAVARAMVHHRIPSTLGKALLAAMRKLDTATAEEALIQALDLRFTFSMLGPAPQRPVLLVGPPGSGKTATCAKLAAQAVLQGAPVSLMTTDTVKAGAVSQLQSLAARLDQDVETFDSPEALNAHLRATAHMPRAVFIDTPGTNPFNKTELRDLARFCKAADAEPVLVIAAGADAAHLADLGKPFQAMGARRMIATGLDATRRFGSLLWLAERLKLAFAQTSMTPYLANGLTHMNASVLAQLLLNVPQASQNHPSEADARQECEPS